LKLKNALTTAKKLGIAVYDIFRNSRPDATNTFCSAVIQNCSTFLETFSTWITLSLNGCWFIRRTFPARDTEIRKIIISNLHLFQRNNKNNNKSTDNPGKVSVGIQNEAGGPGGGNNKKKQRKKIIILMDIAIQTGTVCFCGVNVPLNINKVTRVLTGAF
jgi:hypothetical protein